MEGSSNLVDRKITGDGGRWIVKTCQKDKPKNRNQSQAGRGNTKSETSRWTPKSQMKRGPKEKRRKRKLQECWEKREKRIEGELEEREKVEEPMKSFHGTQELHPKTKQKGNSFVALKNLGDSEDLPMAEMEILLPGNQAKRGREPVTSTHVPSVDSSINVSSHPPLTKLTNSATPHTVKTPYSHQGPPLSLTQNTINP